MTPMTTLHGCIPILVTPFDLAGHFLPDDMARQIDWVIDQGATGVSALAIASEGYKLTDPERDEIAAVVVEATAGRVPVVISADGAGTAVAVDRAQASGRSGRRRADGAATVFRETGRPELAGILRQDRCQR